MATLNLSLINSTPEQSQAFCNDILDTLKKRGVARLSGHGIPNEIIDNLFNMTRQFFALSHKDKTTAKHPPNSTPNRGYSYVGQESVSSISGFEKGLPQGSFIKDVKSRKPLTWALRTTPSSTISGPQSVLPGFRSFMETFYEQCFIVEQTILTALARALHIPETALASLHNAAENEFRLLHYPAIPARLLQDGTSTRIAEHTDFGTITMLFQDSTGGLQVEDQTSLGTFHGIESCKYAIILNIGDSLQRLTNDTLRAACHRVTYPPTVKTGVEEGSEDVIPERFSIAYFAKPNRNASLLPFGEFVDESVGRPCRYDDMTAWEYNNLRITKLYQAAA